ncbi:MAG: hypothetical protein AAF672_09595 [Pseudomonadota bacterium]
MSDNPITRIRFWGNVGLISVVAVAIGNALLTDAYWVSSPWIIGVAAVGYAALSFIAHLRHPEKVDAAWDEQNLAAQRASLVFGYWATLAVFLLLLGAILTERIEGNAAFFWLGPVLGIGPSIHYLASVARGRAE